MRRLVDTVAVTHVATERRIVAGLSQHHRTALTAALRTLAVDLGDDDAPRRS